MSLFSDLKPAANAAVPWTAALLTLAAGVMLLASAATPSEPLRFVKVMAIEPVGLQAASEPMPAATAKAATKLTTTTVEPEHPCMATASGTAG